MILVGFPLPRAHDCATGYDPGCKACVAHDSTCGIRCTVCGERMCSLYGPEPAPRCPEHPCCQPCDDAPVWCRECREVLRVVAEDRAEQVSFDAARERSS